MRPYLRRIIRFTTRTYCPGQHRRCSGTCCCRWEKVREPAWRFTPRSNWLPTRSRQYRVSGNVRTIRPPGNHSINNAIAEPLALASQSSKFPANRTFAGSHWVRSSIAHNTAHMRRLYRREPRNGQRNSFISWAPDVAAIIGKQGHIVFNMVPTL